jgi:hypothetical protein
VGIHQETPLNIDLEINNEREDYKMGIVWGGGERVNEGDKGDGIWLMDFMYLCEVEQ